MFRDVSTIWVPTGIIYLTFLGTENIYLVLLGTGIIYLLFLGTDILYYISRYQDFLSNLDRYLEYSQCNKDQSCVSGYRVYLSNVYRYQYIIYPILIDIYLFTGRRCHFAVL